jgi:mRNA interferase RelE/StbE
MSTQWTLVISNNARKKIASLAKPERQQIQAAINKLAENPYHPALDVKRLEGRSEWRLHVGAWRALFIVDRERLTIQVVSIGPRGDVYKK